MTAKAAKAPTKKTKTTKPKAAAAAKASPKATTKSSTTKTAKAAVTKSPSSPKAGLRAWNLRLGILLLLLAVAIFVFGDKVTAPITVQYQAKDVLGSDAAGHEVVAAAMRHLWDVRVAWMVAKFVAIFGVVFLLAATVLRTKYEAWLDRGVNGLRWVGFGLGGGAAMLAVAMLSGVSDISTLGLIFISVVIAGLLANAVEFIGAGRRLRRLLAAGALLGVFFPWLVFFRTAIAVPLYDGKLPLYMYFLYATMTLLIVAVALALYMRVKQRGKWADTFYSERMFMALAFLVAVVPALQIFAGALQP